METLFRWIHLSDIHFGHGDAAHGWDQKLVIESLRRDIGAMLQKDSTPVDAILVTGDIAFSGNGRRNTEYTDARDRLLALGKEAGVGAERIFVVPGNHDVNRAADRDRSVQRLVEALRAGRDKIDTALGESSDRAMLARRMSAYLEFAAGFAPACLDATPKPPEERLYWTHRLSTKSGLKIRLIGLNTALLSADDQDQGKLYLGREQIARALLEPPVEPGEVVMALSHHPFRASWLGDEKDVDAWVRNNAHIHLSGHVHEPDTEQSRSGAGGLFVRINAGAAHGDQEHAGAPASHGYSFGAIGRDGDKAVLRVWPRKWSPKSVAFRIDQDTVPDGEHHAEHELRVKLPATAASSHPPVVSPGTAASPTTSGQQPVAPSAPVTPTEIFISYAHEDEKLKIELEKHIKIMKRTGLIESWSAQEVAVGAEGAQETMSHLHSARVILLLISPDYLASDECYDVQMKAAVERHDRGEARLIPIVLRPCDFSSAPFAKLRAIPPFPSSNEPKPVVNHRTLDDGFHEVAQGIRSTIEALRKKGS